MWKYRNPQGYACFSIFTWKLPEDREAKFMMFDEDFKNFEECLTRKQEQITRNSRKMSASEKEHG